MRGGGTSSSHDDALLSRLYQQVTAAQEPRFAAGYDLQAGLDRYQGWLRMHTDAAASPALRPPDTPSPGPLKARTRGSVNPINTEVVSSPDSSHTTRTSSLASSWTTADSTASAR